VGTIRAALALLDGAARRR